MPVIMNLPDIIQVDGLDTSDATAKDQHIVAGYTAYAQGQKITGNMPKLEATTYTPSQTDQVIAKEQYLDGDQTILGDENLITGNIKNGISIFGVEGSQYVINTEWQDSRAASASNLQEGRVAFVNGAQITGNTPTLSNAEVIITPTTEDQVISTQSKKVFIDKGLTVLGDENLVAENIRSGVTIFGVEGTYKEAGASIEVPIWINTETAGDTLGANLYFRDTVNTETRDFTTVAASVGDFYSSNYEYALYYTMNGFNWGNTIKTVCSTPIYITPNSLIEYAIASGETTATRPMRLVSATGEGSELVENIFTNANVEGSYYSIDFNYFYQQQKTTFIKPMPDGLVPGYYYLYWEATSDNVSAKFYEITVHTTEEA